LSKDWENSSPENRISAKNRIFPDMKHFSVIPEIKYYLKVKLK
jgi:hypothetical protein